MAGTIAARIAMGAVCDWIGPRLGMSVVLLLSAPCVFGMALADKAIDFIMLRFGIGFGLSTFVACQFWTACMFNVKIVGTPLDLLPMPPRLPGPVRVLISCTDCITTASFVSCFSPPCRAVHSVQCHRKTAIQY